MEQAVEASLNSGRMQESIAAHIEHCPVCAGRELEVRENLRFMRGEFGRAAKGVAMQIRRADDAMGVESGGPVPAGWPGTDVLPGYKLVREIARGGQGVVYEGLQLATRRRVAIKMIEPGSRGTRGMRRMEREAEIAAGLRHPNIVTVYDSAALTDGRYALAMEFVDGDSFDVWGLTLDQTTALTKEMQRAAVRTKLEAFVSVCAAVQHAHQHGIIHRDLKPANILVDREGVVRVVDFGIARKIIPDPEKTGITQAGAFAGTLAYASPEQVSGEHDAVDTRSDIYALGLVLYELLTGRRPYETDGSLTGAIDNIVRVEPSPMRSLVPGDLPAGPELEAIVRMALAKDRNARYQTAAALRDDLENYLAGRAVHARVESRWYALRKAASKHRMAIAMVAGGFVLLGAFAASMAWSSKKLSHQRGLLAASLSSSTIERGRLMGVTGESARAEELIWPEMIRTGADVSRPEGLDPALWFTDKPEVVQAVWALTELYSRHPSLMHMPTVPRVAAAVFAPAPGAPDSSTQSVRMISDRGQQEWRRIPDGAVLKSTPPQFSAPCRRVVVTPSTAVVGAGEGRVFVYDPGSDTPREIVGGDWGNVTYADLTPDGSRLLTVSDFRKVRLWETNPVRLIATLVNELPNTSKPSFSRDGTLLYAGISGEARAWHTSDGTPAFVLKIPEAIWAQAILPSISRVQELPNDQRVVVTVNTSLLSLSKNNLQEPPRVLATHRGYVNAVEFSEDGRVLLTSGNERNCRTWNAETGELYGTFEQTVAMQDEPAISPDGSMFVVCDQQDSFRVFESRPRKWLHRKTDFTNSVLGVRFSPDGSLLAAAGGDGSLRVYDAKSDNLIWRTPSGPLAQSTLAFTPDGRSLAVASKDGTITVFDAATGSNPRPLSREGGYCTWIGYSPDGTILALAGGGPDIQLIDARTGTMIAQLQGHSNRAVEAAFSLDGKTLVSVANDGTVFGWDVATRTQRYKIGPLGAAVRAVQFAPDGKTFVTGSDDWQIRIWDTATGELRQTLPGVKQHVFGLAFHPSGNILFSSCRDSTIQVWDIRTGREVAVLEGHNDLVLCLAMSPDGRKLATGSTDMSLGIWDLGYYRQHIQGNSAFWKGRDRSLSNETPAAER